MKTQNLPKQSAPVIRQVTPATISGEQGVEASLPIVPILAAAAPIVSSLVSKLIG